MIQPTSGLFEKAGLSAPNFIWGDELLSGFAGRRNRLKAWNSKAGGNAPSYKAEKEERSLKDFHKMDA